MVIKDYMDAGGYPVFIYRQPTRDENQKLGIYRWYSFMDNLIGRIVYVRSTQPRSMPSNVFYSEGTPPIPKCCSLPIEKIEIEW